MKDKEKQIEEMAKDYYGYSIDLEDDCKFVAEEMYNKGYRKLPEDSVVLSREEYENKKIIVEMSGGHKLKLTIGKFGEMSKVLEEYTRKETAEKILNETMRIPVIDGKFVKVDDLIDKLEEIATREGVEIKEYEE